MFGWFRKKKTVNDPEFLQQITNDGLDYAAKRLADIVDGQLPNARAAYLFVLQELDGARHGVREAVEFVEQSGIPKSEYINSLSQDTPEIDKAQSFMQMLSMKLYPEIEIAVSLRIRIVDNIMKKYGFGKYE